MAASFQAMDTSEESSEEKDAFVRPKISQDLWTASFDKINLDRDDLNWLALDFLAQKGELSAVRILAEEAKIKLPAEKLESLRLRTEVSKSLKIGDFDLTIKTIKTSSPKLLKVRELVFYIKLLKMISLLKRDKPVDALFTAQNEIATIEGVTQNTSLTKELELISLLTLAPKTTDSALTKYLAPEYTDAILDTIDARIKEFFGVNEVPKIKKFFKQLRYNQIRLRRSVDFPHKLEYADSFYERTKGEK